MLSIYRAQFRVTFATQLQYRAAMLIWQIGTVLEPTIYLVVWRTIARSGGGSVGGYAVADFAAYFLVLMLVNHLTFTWIMWEYEYRIRQGMFSPLLLRPVHPIHMDIADNITHKLLAISILLPATGALWLAFRPALHPPGWAIVAAIPALVLAFALRFLVEWTLAMAAFWTTRTMAVNQLYYITMLFLSGQIAPLELLPGPLRAVAVVMPFRWMVGFPVELVLGRLTPQAAMMGLAMQAVWLVLAFGLFRLVWRGGVRRYAGVGA
jgi:ABC-2 type transport system permease protein